MTRGAFPTFTAAITMFFVVSIIETVPSSFTTYTFVPSGLTATPEGEIPTGTVAITVLSVVLITEVVLLKKFATYALFHLN